MRLIHLSDPHLGPLPRIGARALLTKQVLGHANWQRSRRHRHDPDVLAAVTASVRERAPDHILVTGDLVNLGHPDEHRAAARWLAGLGRPDEVTAVPGNHDAYVPGALAAAIDAWGAFATGDDGTGTPGAFPFVRVREPVAIVGLSSARAMPPFFANGHVGASQTEAVRQRLDWLAAERLFRIVILHHPPLPGLLGPRHRLIGARRVLDAIADAGCELVLHGHTHEASIAWIAGPDRAVPVVGVPSASANGVGGMAARFNEIIVERRGGGFRCEISEHGLRAAGERPHLLDTHVLF